uniref:CSON014883 protein n=1 Tax=Culicoides sonorensis TaxID=179676 RepID=A0A336MC75_CULSO
MNASSGNRYVLQIHVGSLSLHYEALSVEASKQTTAEEIINCITERLGLVGGQYELAEVISESKERRLASYENPVLVMRLWPLQYERGKFREIQSDLPWLHMYPYGFGLDSSILRNFIPFVLNANNRDCPDLCQLPDLSENILLENLKRRFEAGHIYTYIGNILIAVNPFKFHPIYNPKYVRLYQNHRIGPTLPPHIFAIADNAYYSMLQEKKNQVNYKENGVVQGAVVQKYLLEKSRITSQGIFERNYHVFYYLLFGATEQDRESLFLLPIDSYNYLNCKNIKMENSDEKYEFFRLKQKKHYLLLLLQKK